MPHASYTRNLGRFSSFRKATARSLAQALIRHERIRTTLARAKEAQRLTERLVTMGKEGTLSSRRRAAQVLGNQELVHRLFADIAPRFAQRSGGYTRILHGGYRPGDGASVAVIEFVELSPEVTRPKTAAKAAKPSRKPEPPPKRAEAPREIPERPGKEIREKPERGPEKKEEKTEKRKSFMEGLRNLFKKGRSDR